MVVQYNSVVQSPLKSFDILALYKFDSIITCNFGIVIPNVTIPCRGGHGISQCHVSCTRLRQSHQLTVCYWLTG